MSSGIWSLLGKGRLNFWEVLYAFLY